MLQHDMAATVPTIQLCAEQIIEEMYNAMKAKFEEEKAHQSSTVEHEKTAKKRWTVNVSAEYKVLMHSVSEPTSEMVFQKINEHLLAMMENNTENFIDDNFDWNVHRA
jgi:hypothetical protein